MKKLSCLLLFVITVMCHLASSQAQSLQSDEEVERQNSAETIAAPIDFDRARELMKRLRRGDRLSVEDDAFLKKAQAAYRNGQRPRQSPQASLDNAPRESTGLTPLSDMAASDKYKGEDGGLYGQGLNEPPDQHRIAAEKELAHIQPLNRNGMLDPDGAIAFISISMSNATQEFSRFKRIADADPIKAMHVQIIDCAQGGQAMAEWVRPDAPPWLEADRRIKSAGVSSQQVQVAWIKLANKGPSGELNLHGRQLQRDTLKVIQNAKTRYPNLRIAYLSSRIYGGYATNRLNPEPFAYESAFAARWLIQDQINGDKELNFDAERGEVKAPILLWGPYLWADGIMPRRSDSLVYTRDDLGPDGTHPSEAGRDKVARLLLDQFKTNPLARPWFIGSDIRIDVPDVK